MLTSGSLSTLDRFHVRTKVREKLDGQRDFHKLGHTFGQNNDCRRKEDCTDNGQLGQLY